MMDTRARVLLNGKMINLGQLDAETGGHGLVGSDSEVVVVEGSPVTAQQLAEAIAKHVPDPLYGLSSQEVDARAGLGNLANTAGIRAKAKAVLAGTDSFNNQQRDRAIAALILLAIRERADT